MTLSEAMKESKATGRSYMRKGHGEKFLIYDANRTYNNLTAEELIADDWIYVSMTGE